MSFNSIVLIIASIIFILLISVFTYFIYEAQKKKYNISQASCPDYWRLVSKKDANGNVVSSSCSYPEDGTNWGKCNNINLPPIYKYYPGSTKPCDIFLDKYVWTTQACGGEILWDGVTNNDDFRRSCKPEPIS
jgi:hypothetical protein